MSTKPLVAVIMGSKSDWEVMQHTDAVLTQFDVAHECRVLSAHRTPKETAEFVSTAESRGVEVLIAAAGGAAHLAGVCAAHTILPVLGVPMTSALDGLDSLLSTVQMPGGIPVGTLAIGKAGAVNAALLAIEILALQSAGAKEEDERLPQLPGHQDSRRKTSLLKQMLYSIGHSNRTLEFFVEPAAGLPKSSVWWMSERYHAPVITLNSIKSLLPENLKAARHCLYPLCRVGRFASYAVKTR